MAEEKATAAKVPAEPSQSDPGRDVGSDEVAKYTVEELQENARALLSCSPHAVAGALADETRKTWTVDAAAKKVNSFLKRPDSTIPTPEDEES